MISTLHKEMGMMQTQLNKFKEAACEVHSLRAEIHTLAGILERKVWTVFKIGVLDIMNLHRSIVIYSLRPKLLDTFDKNKNTKESVRNLQKRPTRT
jgi:hypothetical protein